MDKPNLLSPSTLAFVGDGVYELLVRERLAEINRPAGELHSLSVKLVNANAQAEGFKIIEPLLSEEELSVFKRGRNFHTTSIPKSSDHTRYHTATGLEALFGFLHLKGEKDRMYELFNLIWQGANEA